MREVKFRAWFIATKKMCGVVDIFFNSATCTPSKVKIIYDADNKIDDVYEETVPIIAVELIQFTGLKDKNGKEIYEGDIFNRGGDIGVVEFADGCFVFSLINFPISMTCRDHQSVEFEVIGNIYENKNLLS